MVEPGRRRLGERFELQQLIAAGGMGQVWQGLDVVLHRPVAVKILRSEYTGDPTFVARFRAEAQHAASLSHPNIAAVFDYGEETVQDGTGETLAYLVMELVEGEPLSALLAREGALDTATTLSFLRQTAFGLGEAHRAGMVHRDVKPGNILVRPDGSVKITDFGIAWSARSVALTRTGQVIGTPQYLSPEQAEGRPATPASDVYALGLIGYECLTGHPAFEGDNAVTIALRQVRQDPEPLPGELPSGVRQLISRALVKDAAARIPDGAAFVAVIDDILAGRPLPEAPATIAVVPSGAVPPPPPTVEEPRVTASVARPPAARRRGRMALVLLPLLALLAGAGIAVALLQAMSDARPSSSAAAAEQRASGSIVLAAEDYIGRPVSQVAERLAALGLQVRLAAQVRDDVVADQVTGVDPAGSPLSSGDTVVVSYAVAPSGSSSSSSSGGGGARSSPPVTAATVSRASTGEGGRAGTGEGASTAPTPIDTATAPTAPTMTTTPTTPTTPITPSSLPATPTESEATESTSTDTWESTDPRETDSSETDSSETTTSETTTSSTETTTTWEPDEP